MKGSLIAGGIGHFEDILNFRQEDTETKKGARIPEDTLNSVYRQIRSYLLAYSEHRPVSPTSTFKKYLTPLDMSRCQGA